MEKVRELEGKVLSLEGEVTHLHGLVNQLSYALSLKVNKDDIVSLQDQINRIEDRR